MQLFELASLSKQQQKRMAVWTKDPYCHYCRIPLAFEDSTLDHKNPVALGGGNSIANLVVSCQFCNNVKASVVYEIFVSRLADPSKVMPLELRQKYREIIASRIFYGYGDRGWDLTPREPARPRVVKVQQDGIPVIVDRSEELKSVPVEERLFTCPDCAGQRRCKSCGSMGSVSMDDFVRISREREERKRF